MSDIAMCAPRLFGRMAVGMAGVKPVSYPINATRVQDNRGRWIE